MNSLLDLGALKKIITEAGKRAGVPGSSAVGLRREGVL